MSVTFDPQINLHRRFSHLSEVQDADSISTGPVPESVSPSAEDARAELAPLTESTKPRQSSGTRTGLRVSFDRWIDQADFNAESNRLGKTTLRRSVLKV